LFGHPLPPEQAIALVGQTNAETHHAEAR